jgi:ribosomal subunit interface protein
MQISVTGHQLDVGDALRGRVEVNLAESVVKYFDHAIDGNVVFSREAHGVRVDISVHVGRGIMAQGHGQADNAHTAFDVALDRIAKRLRRHKRRLRDHHRDQKADLADDTFQAQQYILSGEGEAEDEDQSIDNQDSSIEDADPSPVVIAEMTTRIDTLTVGEAVNR